LYYLITFCFEKYKLAGSANVALGVEKRHAKAKKNGVITVLFMVILCPV
jgi:hypothetical protein